MCTRRLPRNGSGFKWGEREMSSLTSPVASFNLRELEMEYLET